MKKLSSLEKDYKKQVAEAAGKKINEVFSNSSLEHAFFLSQKLIQTAINEIKIVTRKFNSNFYQELLPVFFQFLQEDKNRKLTIAVMEQHDNVTIDDLKAHFPEQVKVVFLNKKQAEALASTEKNVYINFLVNDNDGFRYEYQDEDIEKGVVSAFANFNDIHSASVLNNFFDRLIVA